MTSQVNVQVLADQSTKIINRRLDLGKLGVDLLCCLSVKCRRRIGRRLELSVQVDSDIVGYCRRYHAYASKLIVDSER
jgi:hypothetical protein